MDALILAGLLTLGTLICAPILHLLFRYWPMPRHRDRAAEAADELGHFSIDKEEQR